MQDIASLLAESPPRVTMRVALLLQNICLLPIDPHASAPDVIFDKGLCLALLKNKAVAESLATFAIANAAVTPVTDLEWAGSQALRAFAMHMSVTPGMKYVVGHESNARR